MDAKYCFLHEPFQARQLLQSLRLSHNYCFKFVGLNPSTVNWMAIFHNKL